MNSWSIASCPTCNASISAITNEFNSGGGGDYSVVKFWCHACGTLVTKSGDRTLKTTRVQVPNKGTVHPVWSILQRDKYTDDGVVAIEALYATLANSAGVGTAALYNAVNKYPHETVVILGYLAHGKEDQ